MPLYEYQCNRCAHRFEAIQKFSDPPVDACPKCGGEVKKLLSSPAIQFKGSGWYITDYARAGKSDSAGGQGEKKERKADAAGTGASAAPGESKAGGESTASGESRPPAASGPKTE
jgi:putative FmdB family regulatory protein